MRVRIILAMLSVVCATCSPEQKCGGELYYDPIDTSCRPCPKTSVFESGTCVCKDQYEFVNNACVLMDGAVLPTPDAGDDSGTPSAASCNDYCNFTKACIADNSLAAAALKEVVSGLKADDMPGCVMACKADTGGDGSGDPVVACIQAGREQAACADDDTQAGLGGAIKLMGDCCRSRQSAAMCKSICAGLGASPLVKPQLDFCN